MLDLSNPKDYEEDKMFLTLSVWYKSEKDLTEQEFKVLMRAVENYLETI